MKQALFSRTQAFAQQPKAHSGFKKEHRHHAGRHVIGDVLLLTRYNGQRAGRIQSAERAVPTPSVTPKDTNLLSA